MKIRNFPLFLSLSVILLLVPYILDNYYLHLIIIISVYVILTSSFNLVAGYTGQLSLAHAAFFGVGGYASANLVMKMGISFWLALPIAAAVAALLGFLIGYPSLRVKKHYLVMVTLAFAEIMRLIFNNEVELTGGPDGIPNIPSPNSFSLGIWTIDFSSKVAYYYLALIITLLTLFALFRIVNSSTGRILVSIRENEILSESMGINVMKYKLFSFTVGSAFAGIAGSLYAHYISCISPDAFSFMVMTNILIMTMIGGAGTILGPVIGSITMTFVSEYLRILPAFRWIIYGSVLIIIVIFMPQGIVGALKSFYVTHIRRSLRTLMCLDV